MKNTNVSAVKAKREFTEILGRVSVGRETFTITRHGKTVAVLAPTAPAKGLQALKGWLDDDDPFFRDIQHIIRERKTQSPPGSSRSLPFSLSRTIIFESTGWAPLSARLL